MTFTPSEVKTYYAARVPSLRITSQREWRCPCPVHQGKRDSFSVNAETGLAQCHSECARGWDIVSLEMELSAIDFPKAKAAVFRIVGRPEVPSDDATTLIEALYDYRDENGEWCVTRSSASLENSSSNAGQTIAADGSGGLAKWRGCRSTCRPF